MGMRGLGHVGVQGEALEARTAGFGFVDAGGRRAKATDGMTGAGAAKLPRPG